MLTYKEHFGIHFEVGTSGNVIDIISQAYKKKSVVRFFYGNIETGKDWHDVCNTKGRIGLTCGKIKVPILLSTKRSSSGMEILTRCIVKITIDKEVVYLHSKYSNDLSVVGLSIIDNFDKSVLYNGKTDAKTTRYFEYLKGIRNCI